VLTLTGIHAGYGGPDILRGVSLSVREGERVVILGPNGCGKTTLLRVIAGLLPCRGAVALMGVPVRGTPRRVLAERVALLGQMEEQSPPFTVYDTVMMGRYRFQRGPLGRPDARDRAAVDRCLAEVGMADLAERTLDTLSGGQRQRAYLARTFAQEPGIILLDEPTSHLDLQAQAALLGLLRAWAARPGRAVVGVLHDVTLALMLATRLVLMREGQVLAQGEDAVRPERLREAFEMDVAGYLREGFALWSGLLG
jgi:iron complex transport system ATP-binding protein